MIQLGSDALYDYRISLYPFLPLSILHTLLMRPTRHPLKIKADAMTFLPTKTSLENQRIQTLHCCHRQHANNYDRFKFRIKPTAQTNLSAKYHIQFTTDIMPVSWRFGECEVIPGIPADGKNE